MKRKANSLPNDSLILTKEDLNKTDSDSETIGNTKKRKVKSDDELTDEEYSDEELIQDEEDDSTTDKSKMVDTILKIENRRITIFTQSNKIVEIINNQQTRSDYNITDVMITQYSDRIKNKYLIEESISKDMINYEETDLNIDVHSGLYPEESNLTLYKHQKEGVVWLLKNYFDRNNVILADDMGIGKTVQVISTINYLIKYMKIKGPFLIIVPLSVLSTWENEFKIWKLDHIEVLTYHGSLTRKRALEKYCVFSDEANGRYLYPNVIITTKEAVGKQVLLSKIFWKYVVVDEAHFLSDSKRKLYKKMSQLNTDAFLLLTGTPFQNNLKEFYSLITFLKKDSRFESFKEFKRVCQEEESKFGKMIRNIMLRRTKESVLAGVIKPKEEYFLILEPTPLQKETFKDVKNRYEKEDALAYLSDSIKVANHPFIYLLDHYSTNQPNTLEDETNNDPIYTSRYYKKFLSTISCREHLIAKIINSSSKLIALDYLLEKHYGEGNKVVVFSQYTTTLDFLEYYLILKDYKYQRFDGSNTKSERSEAVESFQHENSQDFVFLLSTKAGGVGLNLVSANVVIEYDITWNPHADEQATNRCHRIGQTKTVYVYKFLIRKSIEDLVLKYTQEKLAMSTRVNSSVTQNSNIEYDYYNMNILSKLKQKELRSILQKKKHKDYYSISTMIKQSWNEYDYKKQFIELNIHNIFEWYSNQHVEILIDIFRNYPSESYILNELKNSDWNGLKSIYKNQFLFEKLSELSNLINEGTSECSFYSFILKSSDFKMREFDLLLTISKYYQDEQFNQVLTEGCNKHTIFLSSLKPLYTIDDIELRFQEELKHIVQDVGKLIEDEEIGDNDYLTKLTESLKELNTTINELFSTPYHQQQVWDYIQTQLGIENLRETSKQLQTFLVEKEEKDAKQRAKTSSKLSHSRSSKNHSKKKVVSSGGMSVFKNKRR